MQKQEEESSLVHSGNSELVGVPAAGVRQEVKLTRGRDQYQKALTARPRRLDFIWSAKTGFQLQSNMSLVSWKDRSGGRAYGSKHIHQPWRTKCKKKKKSALISVRSLYVNVHSNFVHNSKLEML